MKKIRESNIKNTILPCLGLSAVAGAATGVIIFLFKLTVTHAVRLSEFLYASVRSDLRLLPLLILGAALLGMIASIILHYSPSCRGGGIPTSITLLRGLITFQWLRNLLAVFVSATLTYLGGVPLGTEGPSVQIGTAVGNGTSRLLAKSAAWDRYVMTGGACTGFACTTGAPLTGLLFAVEEAHRRFSPLIFISAATAVASGYAASELLCLLTDTHGGLFEIHTRIPTLPLRNLWAPITVGILAGLAAILFTKLYRFFRERNGRIRLPLPFKVAIIFAATVVIGVASANLIGSGHSLIDLLLEGEGVWYMLLIYLAARSISIVIANTVGITGGLFIPSLALGALIGAISANLFIGLNLLPREHYMLLVTVGMVAFLAACSRTPLMAIAFALEALGGFSNLLSMILCVTLAYVTAEASGMQAFSEVVVESHTEDAHRGRTATIVDEHVTVAHDSFAVNKSIPDILWPPTCTVLSIRRDPNSLRHADPSLHEGDILHLHYRTYDNAETKRQIEAIVGSQSESIDEVTSSVGEQHITPQL